MVVATYGRMEATRRALANWLESGPHGAVLGSQLDIDGTLTASLVLARLESSSSDDPMTAMHLALQELATYALFIASKINTEGTWTDASDVLLLGLVIAVMAPLGDLTESMFKRNLDVKDFGALVSGHGGVLDRFDAFLFVLPVTYYVTLVLEPWV